MANKKLEAALNISQKSRQLGKIIAGNLTSLVARISEDLSVEEATVGEFITIKGEKHQFFGITTNLELASVNKELDVLPPDDNEQLLTSVLRGLSNYSKLEMDIYLTKVLATGALSPAKTIPVHYSEVRTASYDDVTMVFGVPNHENMEIGSPPNDPSIPLCLNMDRYVERSNGVFGKTGTGKTFLVRLLLANLIKNDKVTNIIFDLHNEYGYSALNEETKTTVKGLKQLFMNKVLIFTLDPESSNRRKVVYDYEVQIPYSSINPEDILLLRRELNLNETASEIMLAVQERHDRNWLAWFLSLPREQAKDEAESLGVHTGAFRATHSKLRRLLKLPFLMHKEQATDDTIQRIMDNISLGKHIVIEFGKHSNSLVNILVSNLLTRRIHALYVKKMEEYMATLQNEPKKLMITIEEAHKFLTRSLSSQTIFSTIARELRKYNVVLQIVDQRPSGIDPEILSQLGTRLTGALNDENDINATLVGVSKAQSLRLILENLEPKRNVLIFGYGTPIPISVRVKPYDENFYQEIQEAQLGLEASIDPEKELFG